MITSGASCIQVIQLCVSIIAWIAAFAVAYWAQKRTDRRNQLERCIARLLEMERTSIQYWSDLSVDGAKGKAAALRVQNGLQKLADVGALVAEKLSAKEELNLLGQLVDCRIAAGNNIEDHVTVPPAEELKEKTQQEIARKFSSLSQNLESIYERMTI